MKNVCTAYLIFSKSLNELLKRSLQTFELQTLLFFHFRFVRRVLRTPSRRVCRVAQVCLISRLGRKRLAKDILYDVF